MSYARNDLASRDFLMLVATLVVPLAVCIVIMLVEPGIELSLLYAAIQVALTLIALGLVLSFVASRFAGRTDRTDGAASAPLPPSES